MTHFWVEVIWVLQLALSLSLYLIDGAVGCSLLQAPVMLPTFVTFGEHEDQGFRAKCEQCVRLFPNSSSECVWVCVSGCVCVWVCVSGCV